MTVQSAVSKFKPTTLLPVESKWMNVCFNGSLLLHTDVALQCVTSSNLRCGRDFHAYATSAYPVPAVVISAYDLPCAFSSSGRVRVSELRSISENQYQW